ncbi:MAG: nuclear transport factor 2 family protein [Pseudomonadota bacterium]
MRATVVFRLILSALLPAALLASTSADAGEIEDACTELVMGYALHRDQFNVEAYGDLFSEDAVLFVLGSEYRGRAAIRQRLEDARGKEFTRHLMSGVWITVLDEQRASGISYASIHAAEPDELPLKPVPPAVGEYHDEFTLTEDGWKISRRRFVPVFLDPSVLRPAGR